MNKNINSEEDLVAEFMAEKRKSNKNLDKINIKACIFLTILWVVVLLTATACTQKYEDEITGKPALEPNLVFKKLYESLNDAKNDSGQKYRQVSIPNNNPFISTSAEDILKHIENKETFYVYFGSIYCPWCRSVIESAIKSANNNNIYTIYYVEIWEDSHKEILRDEYKINENNDLILAKTGTQTYKELLKYFDNVLNDYILTDINGEKISMNEKRIFAPSFIYVEDGEAAELTTGISKLQISSSTELTNEILEDQENIFNQFFHRVKECNEEPAC